MKKKLYYLSLMILPVYLIFFIPYFKTKLDYYYGRFLMTMQVRYFMDVIVGIAASVFIFILINNYNEFKQEKINKIILISAVILLSILWCLSIFRVVYYFFNPYTLFFIIGLYSFLFFDKSNGERNS
ncbi:hypothetical protein [Anaerofustis stercorihominis]|uniref:Uncharacterized protein n=1 Tax=Anaerofustis stercorihominis TaxID=214853 RepID=A0A3E3E1V9_9FIRM|nr:hypothetical protein [Anaerofustis stercorihominis]RGD75540.1 hypothetical protein DW687_04225 [Anaerofustis stercorihominis]